MPEILGLATGVFFMAILFKPLFGNAEGFLECVKFWLKPDIFSFFSGEYHKDRISEMKLGLWLIAGIASGFITWTMVNKVI